jgi:hypothetical protein
MTGIFQEIYQLRHFQIFAKYNMKQGLLPHYEFILQKDCLYTLKFISIRRVWYTCIQDRYCF